MTQAELIRRVLSRIGVLAAGETPSSEDSKLVAEAVVSVLAELQVDTLTSGISSDDFPAWSQNIIRDLVMYEVGPHFGITVPIEIQREAMNRLRHQQGSQYRDAEILQIQRF